MKDTGRRDAIDMRKTLRHGIMTASAVTLALQAATPSVALAQETDGTPTVADLVSLELAYGIIVPSHADEGPMGVLRDVAMDGATIVVLTGIALCSDRISERRRAGTGGGQPDGTDGRSADPLPDSKTTVADDDGESDGEQGE